MATFNSPHFEDRSVMQRTGIIGIVVLLAFFIGIFFLSNKLTDLLPRWHLAVLTGLRLFAIWLVVTSIVRSIARLRNNINGGKLLLVGTLMTGATLVFYWIFLFAYREIALQKVNALNSFSWERIGFFTGIGLLISVFTLINLRIQNRLLGNILEILIIGGIIAGIIFLSQ